MRVSDIDLWEAPLAYVGQTTVKFDPSSTAPRFRTPSWWTPTAGRSAGCRNPISSATRCRRPPTPARADPRPRGRDARRPRRPPPVRDPVRAGRRRPRRIAGILSVEIIQDFLGSPRPRRRSTRRPSGRWPRRSCAATAPRLSGQSSYRQSTAESPSADTASRTMAFCPDWAIDNFDRYVTPALEHIFLSIVSVGSASRSRSCWRSSPTGGAG